MNHSRLVRILITLMPILAACSPAAPVIYETVSAGTLKPGSAIPAATGEIIMRVDGKISQTNAGDAAEFDMATLESIGLVQYDVDDPFAKTKIVYTGVLVSELLKVVGAAADATTLNLKALDDYSTDLKISDVDKWPVLLATRADGAYMPVDKNGPVISVFPFDDFPQIDHLTYDALWVWSLTQITVR